MNSWRSFLSPLTPLYRLGLNLRERRLASGTEPIGRLRFPVVSIGNLSTGGAGKTPMAIALAKALAAQGVAADVLSRGYGRSSTVPALVYPNGTAEEFGDEPLLIAREVGVPVYVAPQRYDAGGLAETNADRPTVHLLDDGFQHRQLHRDVDILLLSRTDWQDRLLPAGDLREPLHAAKRADVIAIQAEDAPLESELRAWGWAGPVWRLKRHMDVPAINGPVVAFCGIARPDQFFTGLEKAGVQIAQRFAFQDHHRYTAADLRKLGDAARRTRAVALMTTQKDQVRLGAFKAAVPILPAGLRIEIENEAAAVDWLIAQLRRSQPLPL